MIKDVQISKSVLIAALLIFTLLPDSVLADNTAHCTYLDYNYTPHPDWKIGGNKPRTFRLTIKKNPDFKGSEGGIREIYYLDTLNPETPDIQHDKDSFRM